MQFLPISLVSWRVDLQLRIYEGRRHRHRGLWLCNALSTLELGLNIVKENNYFTQEKSPPHLIERARILFITYDMGSQVWKFRV